MADFSKELSCEKGGVAACVSDRSSLTLRQSGYARKPIEKPQALQELAAVNKVEAAGIE